MGKIAFEAMIKKFTIKSLVCGEKEAELVLRMQDENVKDEVLNSLNTLQRADKHVVVVIMDKENAL